MDIRRKLGAVGGIAVGAACQRGEEFEYREVVVKAFHAQQYGRNPRPAADIGGIALRLDIRRPDHKIGRGGDQRFGIDALARGIIYEDRVVIGKAALHALADGNGDLPARRHPNVGKRGKEHGDFGGILRQRDRNACCIGKMHGRIDKVGFGLYTRAK